MQQHTGLSDENVRNALAGEIIIWAKAVRRIHRRSSLGTKSDLPSVTFLAPDATGCTK
jgi:hypothetical protein